MTADEFAIEVLDALPYAPNDQQMALAQALARFIAAPPGPDRVFLLNGYAGTGKTSLTGALVKVLKTLRRPFMLLAPTGRAAKVFSANAGGIPAYTIHRKIYRHYLAGIQPDAARTAPMQAENKLENAVFIVDEASMIGADNERGTNLLEDLITFVYSGQNCRLILIGDTAQLPPVGSDISPAMNPDTLRALGLKVTAATLTMTARQAADSGILFNATRLRRTMARIKAAAPDAPVPVPKLCVDPFDDVEIVSGEDLPDIITDAYSEGLTDTIVITRSNRRAAEYNAAIRSQVLFRENEIETGDMLIVSRNHYFGKKNGAIEFVANGDILTVAKVYGTENRFGLRFADVALTMPHPDPEGEPITFDIKILLDSLASPEASISRQAWNDLYYGIVDDNGPYANMPVEARLKALRTDPYWTALHVKYAYAVTCHKAQGGQWNNVFIDLSYIPDDAFGLNLYRWFYTAVTRARTNLFLIAPPEALL